MNHTNPKVAAMVERALAKDPALSSAELKKRAKKIDASVTKLSGRQFHARYALPVRRRLSPRRAKATTPRTPRRKKGAKPSQSSTESVLADAFEQRKAALNAALDAAFERAVQADSATRIERLLAAIALETGTVAEL